MQTNKQHTDFIRLLKQRPKQSTGPTLRDNLNDILNVIQTVGSTATTIATQYSKQLASIADDLFELFRDSTEVIEDVTNNIAAASNEQGRYLAGLNKNLAVNRQLLKVQTEASKKTLFLEKRNVALNKTFGVGIKDAAKLSEVYALQAETLGISHKNAMAYAGSINNIVTSVNIMGKANTIQYENLSAIQKVLVTNMQLEEKAAEEFTYYATQQGKLAGEQLLITDEIAKTIDGKLGTENSFLIITEQIKESSASTQLQFGRIAGSLELAAIKGKNLGLTLDQVAGIGNKMLDIESSIGDELEYQLLSGRRLIGADNARADLKGKSLTNAFREAALMGDAEKQADALNAILEQEGTTLTENVLARQQMAKLLGMEENQLARALQKKKLLEQMGADKDLFNLEGSKFAAEIERMKAQGTATDAQIKEAIKLRDRRTTEQKMDDQVDILEDQKILAMLQTDQLTKIDENSRQQIEYLKAISGKTVVKSATELGEVGGLSMQTEAFDQLQSIITGIKSMELKEESADDFLAINGKLVKYRKDDLVIGGTFGGRRQEVINQVTQNASGGGGGGGMTPEQFAQAIVSAMKSAKFNVAVDDVAAMFVNT